MTESAPITHDYSMKEKLYDVFISHAKENEAVARAISHHFELCRARSFLARDRIDLGSSWRAELAEALEASRSIVLVVSKESMASRFVREEIITGIDAGVMIIPFKLEDVEYHPEIRLPLKDKHWLDAIDPPMEAHIQKLVASVCKKLGIHVPDPDTGGNPPPPPPSPLPPPAKRFLPWVVTALILFAGLITWMSTRSGEKLTIPHKEVPPPGPKLELFTVDGLKPLNGQEVEAFRQPDFSDANGRHENVIGFKFTAKVVGGSLPLDDLIEVQYNAVEVASGSKAPEGRSSVDAAVISNIADKKWSAVQRLDPASASGLKFKYCSTANAAPQNPVWMHLIAGKNGFFPEGKLPVHLVYHAEPNNYDSKVLAEADVTLLVPLAPSRIEFVQENGTPLQGNTIKATRGPDVPGKGGSIDNGINFTVQLKSIGAPLGTGSIEVRYPAVSADDPKANSTDGIVVDPAAIWSEEWRPVYILPDAPPQTHYFLSNAERIQPQAAPAVLSLYVGKRGRIPAGLVRGIKVVFLSLPGGKGEIIGEAEITLDVEPKLELLTVDGLKPLNGQEVEAFRLGHPANTTSENGIGFLFTTKVAGGTLPLNNLIEVQYDAIEVMAGAKLPEGKVAVDAAVVSKPGEGWTPVIKLNPAAQPPPKYGYAGTCDNGTAYLPDGTPKSSILMLVQNGKNGFFPEGKIPVHLAFHSEPGKYSSRVLAEADVTLLVPSPWSVADPKLRLYGEDGTPLDSKPVLAKRLSPAPDGNSGPLFSFVQGLEILAVGVEGPADLNWYLLDARYSDETARPDGSPWTGKEIVMSSGLFQKSHVLNGNFIEMPNPNWMSGGYTRKKYPTVTSVVGVGPNGALPAGEHELGVEIVKDGEALYRAKIKVIIPEP